MSEESIEFDEGMSGELAGPEATSGYSQGVQDEPLRRADDAPLEGRTSPGVPGDRGSRGALHAAGRGDSRGSRGAGSRAGGDGSTAGGLPGRAAETEHRPAPSGGRSGPGLPAAGADGSVSAGALELPLGAEPRSERERILHNLQAVRIVVQLRKEGLPASEAELEQLRQWRGWGATPALFESRKRFVELYRAEREELQALLTQEEYVSARASTLNAHYTNPLYASLIWTRLLAKLGAESGAKITVYDNSVGAGRLLADAPADARLIGTETDPITAAIAQALFPHADIRNESFAKVTSLGEPVHVVIANVPYGRTKLSDKVHNPGRRHSIHNHAILQTLEQLAPGGLAAVVTSRYTSDGTDRAHRDARARMLEMAEFLGAVRLPDGAHMDEAGTPVVTDVLFFRKRPEGDQPGAAGEWLTVSPVELPAARAGISITALPINDYFQAHPELVLGTPLADVRRHGTDLSVHGHGELADGLAIALDHIADTAVHEGQTLIPASTFHADIELLDGTLQAHPDGTFTEIINGRPTAHVPAKAQADELRALIRMRDVVVALLDEEATHAQATERMQRLRTELNRCYDAYATIHGPLNRFTLHQNEDGESKERRTYPRMGGFRHDPYAPYVLALEQFDEAAQQATKADLLHKRVIAPPQPLHSAQSAEDALLLCWDRYNEVRLDVIADLLGLDDEQSAREALGELVYDEPALPREATDEASPSSEGDRPVRLMRAADYLSGNVRKKLAAAQEAAQRDPAYRVNVEALRKVIPRDLEPAEIESSLGTSWVSAAYVQAFLHEVLEDDDITVSNLGARWSVKGGDRKGLLASTTWGTQHRSAQELASNLLNNQEIEITRKHEDGTVEVLREATAFAQAKALQLDERFRLWLWEDPERAEHLHRFYNDRFNARVDPNYDGIRIAAPGLSQAFTLNPHQHSAVARLRSSTTGVGLWHGTGAGKTLEMIVGGMELVRLGLVRKPVYTVPKGVLGQFQREFLQAYPRARILVADSEDLTGKRRHRFVAKWSTGNWDAVIISHNAFKKIPMSKPARLDYINQQIERLQAHLDNADGDDRFTVKDIENQIATQKEKLEEELQTPGDSGVEFERTGSSFVFIDEFQVLKNLQVISSVKELALPGNQITAHMDMVLSYLRKTYGPRAACGATATPVDNSPLEILTATKLLAPDLLEELGIIEDDQFVSTFIQPVQKFELGADGRSFSTRTRYVRYVNQTELKRILASYADVRRKQDLPLDEPAVIGGTMRLLTNEAPPELREVMVDLGQRMLAIKAKSPRLKIKKNGDEADDNPLWISTDGRLASLDVRLVGKQTSHRQKIDVVADEIYALWQKHRQDVYYDKDGNQEPHKGSLIFGFCDLGVPAPDKEFDFYNGLRDLLVAKGMPSSLIAFAQDAKNQQQKRRQDQAANEGRIHVLLGGRSGLGTGRNLQRRAVAVIQIDPTWKATPITQSLGRGKRQGNQNKWLHHLAAVTLDSYDPFLWQKVGTKQSYAEVILDFNNSVRIFEASGDDDNVIPAGVIFAVAANRPELAEIESVEGELARLKLRQKMWNDEQFTYRVMQEQGSRRLAEQQQQHGEARRALDQRTPTQGDAFTISLGRRTYDGRREAGTALLHHLAQIERRATNSRRDITQLGHFGGFDLSVSVEPSMGGHFLSLYFAGAPVRPVDLDPRDLSQQDPIGLIRKLENALDSLDTVVAGHAKQLQRLEANIARASERVGRPFEHQEELERVARRHSELQLALGPAVKDKNADAAQTSDTIAADPVHAVLAAADHAAAAATDTPPAPTSASPAPSESADPQHEAVPAQDPAPHPGTNDETLAPPQQAPPAPSNEDHTPDTPPQAPTAPHGSRPAPFTTAQQWQRELAVVESAEQALNAAAWDAFNGQVMPAALMNLTPQLFTALHADDDQTFGDAQTALTTALHQLDQLQRTLTDDQRTALQPPLRTFTDRARTFLQRHRAALRQGEDSLTADIRSQARTGFQQVMKSRALGDEPVPTAAPSTQAAPPEPSIELDPAVPLAEGDAGLSRTPHESTAGTSSRSPQKSDGPTQQSRPARTEHRFTSVASARNHLSNGVRDLRWKRPPRTHNGVAVRGATRHEKAQVRIDTYSAGWNMDLARTSQLSALGNFLITREGKGKWNVFHIGSGTIMTDRAAYRTAADALEFANQLEDARDAQDRPVDWGAPYIGDRLGMAEGRSELDAAIVRGAQHASTPIAPQTPEPSSSASQLPERPPTGTEEGATEKLQLFPAEDQQAQDAPAPDEPDGADEDGAMQVVVPVFTTHKQWQDAFVEVDAAEIALSSAAGDTWARDAVPHAFTQLRRHLFEAVAAMNEGDFHDTESSLTQSLQQAERLLRTLRGGDRATMGPPLDTFANLTRTFLASHRATLAHTDAQDGLARTIEHAARAQFEEFMRTWSAQNTEVTQAVRDGADDDTVRAKAIAARAPQPPAAQPPSGAPDADTATPDTATPTAAAGPNSSVAGTEPTDPPSPFRTDDDIAEALARLDEPLRRWTATGLRDDLFIRGSHTESHQHAAAIERLRRPGRPNMGELRAALAAAEAILDEIEERPGVDFSGRAKPALTELRAELQTILARATQTRQEKRRPAPAPALQPGADTASDVPRETHPRAYPPATTRWAIVEDRPEPYRSEFDTLSSAVGELNSLLALAHADIPKELPAEPTPGGLFTGFTSLSCRRRGR
ncbi:hypothetical protein AB0D37_40195 [Streptomyces sp. NPDC048384]|uniref:hypothetical protein n=1 Tax=Streptomyces sp. NPDC048384 TaxID=3155487 RepID=UPI003447919A